MSGVYFPEYLCIAHNPCDASSFNYEADRIFAQGRQNVFCTHMHNVIGKVRGAVAYAVIQERTAENIRCNKFVCHQKTSETESDTLVWPFNSFCSIVRTSLN